MHIGENAAVNALRIMHLMRDGAERLRALRILNGRRIRWWLVDVERGCAINSHCRLDRAIQVQRHCRRQSRCLIAQTAYRVVCALIKNDAARPMAPIVHRKDVGPGIDRGGSSRDPRAEKPPCAAASA
jgi:hypothetical protein